MQEAGVIFETRFGCVRQKQIAFLLLQQGAWIAARLESKARRLE
jgi:hypothetical protein